jgi:tRNA pseudouridine13 synthase
MIIRRQPTDFQVRETLRPDLLRTQPDAFTLFSVEKTSLTTPEAAARLAKALGVKASVVSYAGLKDKHAVTHQHMAVPTAKNDSSEGGASTGQGPGPDALSQARGITAKQIGYCPSALSAADIERNSFVIVVRGCTRANIAAFHKRGGSVRTPTGDLPIVNYFGEQRFGSARHGAGFIAAHLIKGEFEQALKLAIATPARKDSGSRREFTRAAATNWGNWKRAVKLTPACPQRAALEALAAGKDAREAFAELPYVEQEIFVDAYQSHLWNRIVAAWARNSPYLLESSNLREDGMVFPADGRWPGYVAAPAIDLPSPSASYEPGLARIVTKVLEEEQTDLRSLTIPGLRRPAFTRASRPAVVWARNVSMEISKDEVSGGKAHAATFSFDLPPGTYATVALRLLGQ